MSVATRQAPIDRRGWRIAWRRVPGGGLRGLLPLALLIACWQLFGADNSYTFPKPDTWITSLRDMHDQGVLLPAVSVTLRTFAYSLVAATVLGVLLGVLIGGSRTADRALGPILDFFRSLPPPAIVPVAGLLLGLDLKMSVVVVTIAIVWPILLNTASAMSNVPRVRIDMSRTLGISWTERYRKVILPSLLPSVMVGVRISVSISLVVTLVVDILGSGAGLGRLISERQTNFDAPGTWGLLAPIGLFGFLLNGLLAVLERRILRNWPEAR